MGDKLEDDQQLSERIQLRDSLRKRRVELLTEVSQLQTRKLELQQIKEVSDLNNEYENVIYVVNDPNTTGWNEDVVYMTVFHNKARMLTHLHLEYF